MRLRRHIVLISAGAVLQGCADWPRFGNLPSESLQPAGTDPRELFDLSWQDFDEVEPNDSPVEAFSFTATEEERALNVTGTLTGIGWDNNKEQVVVDNPSCSSSTGVRSPLESGDYTHDVDFFVVTIGNPATLCARLAVDETGVSDDEPFGWDLLLYPLDECLIPGDPVRFDADTVLGLTGGGAVGGWGSAVGAGTYGVMVAGYAPYGPEVEIPYQLGVSLVPNEPDGSAGLCPLLSGEATTGGAR